MPLNALELTGRARTHIVDLDAPRCSVHRDVVAPLLAMRAAASGDGIDLVPVSGFRDFDRQLLIWNGKFHGERPALDRNGCAIDLISLIPAQRVDAILWWSALPGASRHHWGTELDVIDRAALPEPARPELVAREYAAGGVFARLNDWLDAEAHRFGFFRPYATDRGGVSPEPWHLSHAGLAQAALQSLTVEVLHAALEQAPLAGRNEVLARLSQIHAHYVATIDLPSPDLLIQWSRLS